MRKDARELVWYLHWGKHLLRLTRAGLALEDAIKAAKESDHLLRRVGGYRHGHARSGSPRALEAAIEDVRAGRVDAILTAMSNQARETGQRAVFVADLDARRALFQIALGASDQEVGGDGPLFAAYTCMGEAGEAAA